MLSPPPSAAWAPSASATGLWRSACAASSFRRVRCPRTRSPMLLHGLCHYIMRELRVHKGLQDLVFSLLFFINKFEPLLLIKRCAGTNANVRIVYTCRSLPHDRQNPLCSTESIIKKEGEKILHKPLALQIISLMHLTIS